MFKSQIARTLVCLALVFVLVFNIYAMPTKAVAAGTVVTVGAALFVTAALVALGISAGNSMDDFNSIRDDCTTTLQKAGVIGEYVTGYLVDGKVNFWERLIEEVRSWTWNNEVFVSSDISEEYLSVHVSNRSLLLSKLSDLKSRYPYWFWIWCPSNSVIYIGGSSIYPSVDGRYINYNGLSYGFTPNSLNPSVPNSTRFLAGSDIELHVYSTGIDDGLSSSYDVSLGDVAPDNTELSSHYTDWAAGAISVPGSYVGADTDEDVVSFPLGLGDTVDGTFALDQSAVQSGVGTYTGEVVAPDDGGSVDPDLSGAVTAAGLAGLFSQLQDFLTGRFQSLVNLLTVVRDWTENWWDKLGTTFPALMSEWWSDVWTHVDDSFDTVLIGIRDGLSGIRDWTDTWWDDLVTTFPDAMSKWWEDVWTHVDDTFDSVLVGIRDGIAGIRTWANSFWDTLTVTLPLTLSEWWSKVWADARSIPEFLTDALGLAADKIVTAVNDLIVPPEDYLSDKLNAIKEKYSFVESILATIGLIQNALNVSYTEPPVIYAELGAAESLYGYDYGGRVAILDMSWYAEYKPTVDKLLSAFFIFCFCWKIFKKLPGYIQGAPDDISFGSSGLPAVTHRTSSFKSDIKSISVRRGR